MINEAKEFLRTREKMNLLIVLANLLVFAVLDILGDPQSGSYMLKHGACYTPLILEGEYYRLFTAMFLHFSLQHLLYNMLCLIALGDILEKAIGPWRYLLIYIGGGLCGNLLSLWLDMRSAGSVPGIDSYAVSAGASGAVFAVVGAVLWIAWQGRRLGEPGRFGAKRMGFAVVLMIMQGFTDSGVDNAAHIGGLAAGMLLALLLRTGRGKRTGE